jgi:chromosome segregation ATPase
VGGEKTIVLGCYIGNDSGIYVYQVDDERLHGVEQVTTAHEMLHAAYRRLSKNDRQKVDAMLTDYYEHNLTDQRIKDIIDAYKQSEPDDVVNEMHSIFGTELANLPSSLETYYKRYFTDRSKVTDYAARYQAEFTTRQAQITQYDAQLKSLKPQIEANQASLTQQKASLDSQSRKMESLKTNGQTAAYNNEVPGYNRAVDAYNTLRNTTKNLIDQYNTIVDTRNAIALEEHELTQELSASALSS